MIKIYINLSFNSKIFLVIIFDVFFLKYFVKYECQNFYLKKNYKIININKHKNYKLNKTK